MRKERDMGKMEGRNSHCFLRNRKVLWSKISKLIHMPYNLLESLFWSHAALYWAWHSPRDSRPLRYAFVPMSHLYIACQNSSIGWWWMRIRPKYKQPCNSAHYIKKAFQLNIQNQRKLCWQIFFFFLTEWTSVKLGNLAALKKNGKN